MLPLWRKANAVLLWLLAALVESAVTVPWLILAYSVIGVVRWPEAMPGVWLLILIYVAAGLSAEPRQNPRHRTIAMVVGMAGAYLVAYLLVPAPIRTSPGARTQLAFAFLPAAAYLWYRGTRAALQGLDDVDAFDRFYAEALILGAGVLLLVLTGGVREARVQLFLYWSVLLFFVAGLLMLVLAKEQALRRAQRKAGDHPGEIASFSPLMAGLVLGLLSVTLLISQILSVDRLRSIAGAVWNVVKGPLDLLLWPFKMVAFYFLLFVFWLVDRFKQFLLRQAKNMPPQREPMVDEEWLEKLQYQSPPTETGELAIAIARWGFLLLALAVLGVIIYRLNRYRAERVESEEEERINLGFWASLWADLRGAVRRSGRLARALAGAGCEENLDPRDPRMLFRRLQEWGAGRGRARLASETPSAYGSALSGVTPAVEPEVGAVVAVYNAARYGATAPPVADVSEAVEAMERLRQSSQGPKGVL